MTNVLIITAHLLYEGWSTGGLNRLIVDEIEKEMLSQGFSIKNTNIDKGYDIEEEVNKHLWADLIILQTPVNWFSAPWKHKKYLDEIFNEGLSQQSLIVNDGRDINKPENQYGTGGRMGKKAFMLSLTWNAPSIAFSNFEQYLFSGKNADDAFLHITSCYKFCGAKILPSFSFYDVIKDPKIKEDIERLKSHLSEIIKLMR